MMPTHPSDPGLYARSFVDVYADWYGDLDDPSHLVAAVRARCAAGATVVELGSGTGRLALPLFDAGFRVLAVDISFAMLTRAGRGPTLLQADITALPLRDRSADVVVVAYNTLFNLPSRALQQQCFDEVARVLRPGGSLAIEAFVAPTSAATDFGLSTRSHPSNPTAQLTIVTGPHPTEPDVIVGSHVEHGDSRTCRPWQLLYQDPNQLDAAARRADMALDGRYGDWSSSRFDNESDRHVSWYKPI